MLGAVLSQSPPRLDNSLNRCIIRRWHWFSYGFSWLLGITPTEVAVSDKGDLGEEDMPDYAQEVLDALSGVGLSNDEVRVYQSILALGQRPASVIAQKAGLKRSHTYNILGGLKQKGIVQEVIRNSVRHFSCSPPKSLIAKMESCVQDLQHKKRRLEDIVPILENMTTPLSKQPKVRFYQGKDGVHEIFEDILNHPSGDMHSVVDFRYSWSTVDQETHEWVKAFIARREERNIWWRAIAVKSDISDRELSWRSSRKREVKMLEGPEIGAEINIYGSKVALTSTYHEMIGVVIDDKPIADTLRSVHQGLSALLPDYTL